MVKKIIMMLLAAMPMLAGWGYKIETSSRLYYFEDEGESDYRNGYRTLSRDKWFEWSSSYSPSFLKAGDEYSWNANILSDHKTVKDWGLIKKNNAPQYPYFDFDKVEWLGMPSTDYTHVYNSSCKDSYLTLWLRWYRFNIMFDSNGGSEVDPISDIPYKVSTGVKDSDGYLTYTEQTVILPSSERIGYTFNGWQRSGISALLKGNVKSSDIGVDSDGENIKLTAKWTANTYTVTFDANGGSVSPSGLTVTYNSTYGTLPEPTRVGYQFNGWYTAADGGSQVKADTKVSIVADQTLYAHWTEMYTVSFKSEGGTVYASYSVLYGEKVTPPSVDVPVGKRLVGWEYGDRTYAPTERIEVRDSMDLVAKFEMLHTEIHSLSCDPVDGGSVELSPVGEMYGDYGREVTLTAIPYVSHNFVRWSDGSTDPNHKVRIVCDTNFVAHFEKKYFTVNFFDMDGMTPLTAAQRIEYGNPAVAPSAPLHVGLTFTGWEPSDFGSVVSNMSIVAQYETNSYTVVYDPNGGTGSMTNDVFMYFMEYSLQSNEFVRPVHEFVGWSTDPNAATNEVEYADGVVVSNLTAVAGGTNVLYAVWHSLISEYSIAADCTNLVLECAREDRKWSIDPDYGFASTSSVVAAGYRICDMTTLIEGTGTLTFRVKILTASDDNKEFNFYVGDGYNNTVSGITELYYNKELNGDWILCVFSKTEPAQQKFMWNFVGKSDGDKVYVDQVRWYPDRLVSVNTSGSSWIVSGHEVNGITESLLSHWDEILPSGITEAHIDATKSDGAEALNSSVTNALAILNLGYAPEYTDDGSIATLTFADAPVLAINAFEIVDSAAAFLDASVTNTALALPKWSEGVDRSLGVWGAPTLTSDWSRVEAGCDFSRYVSDGIALFNFDVGTNRFFKVKAE